MIEKIPNIVFRLNPGNFPELLSKCSRSASLITSNQTPWTSRYQTQWFYEETKMDADIPDLIRRLAKKHGFANFKSGPHGGSCINVAKGVSISWSLEQYDIKNERGYYFDRIDFYVRKARTLTGYGESQYEYKETSYVKAGDPFTLDIYASLLEGGAQSNGGSTFKGFTIADEMFRAAFKYAEGLQGDPAVTKSSLRKQILQNMIMSSILEKIKKNVSFTLDDKIIRFDYSFTPAKAPEDSCCVDVRLVSSAADTDICKHAALTFWLSQKQFKLRDDGLGYKHGFSKSVDFSDPSFDIDNLYLWFKDILQQYFKTAVKSAELKRQAASLIDAAERLSIHDSHLFEQMFDANFVSTSEQTVQNS